MLLIKFFKQNSKIKVSVFFWKKKFEQNCFWGLTNNNLFLIIEWPRLFFPMCSLCTPIICLSIIWARECFCWTIIQQSVCVSCAIFIVVVIEQMFNRRCIIINFFTISNNCCSTILWTVISPLFLKIKPF